MITRVRQYKVILSFVLMIYGMSGFALERVENGIDDKRVALVIGNAAYQNAPLQNPVNDARDIAVALKKLNFDVLLFEDVNRDGMRDAIRLFRNKLDATTVGLFYYAGHGMQVAGANYLIPVNASIASVDEVVDESLDAALVLRAMKDIQNPLNIVILDACRNNPFSRSFRTSALGLARMNAPTGTLVAYSTSPGSVASDGDGRNGLYTQFLLETLPQPGLSVEQVFKQVRVDVRIATSGEQVPWEESSLTQDFYFAAGTKTVEDGISSRVSVAQTESTSLLLTNVTRAISDDTQTEHELWRDIANSRDPEDFKLYLERYPQGIFAAYARSRLKQNQIVGKRIESADRLDDSDQIARWLMAAGKAFDEGRLIQPLTDNAYSNYLSVLDQQPENAQALKGIERIADKYLAMASQQQSAGNKVLAQLHIERALAILPGYQRAIVLANSFSGSEPPIYSLPIPGTKAEGSVGNISAISEPQTNYEKPAVRASSKQQNTKSGQSDSDRDIAPSSVASVSSAPSRQPQTQTLVKTTTTNPAVAKPQEKSDARRARSSFKQSWNEFKVGIKSLKDMFRGAAPSDSGYSGPSEDGPSK